MTAARHEMLTRNEVTTDNAFHTSAERLITAFDAGEIVRFAHHYGLRLRVDVRGI